MAENRVVIKINYDKDKPKQVFIEPKMTTVWHTRRILTVLVILLLLGIAVYSGFSGVSPEDNKPLPDKVNNIPDISPPSISESALPTTTSIPPETKTNTEQTPVSKRPAAIILNKRVIRALLSSTPIKDEPGKPIELPVLVEQNQTLELFYFVQIKNMGDSILFHRWYKDGQLISQKQFNAKPNNTRLISSRKLTSKDAGQWRVVLMDKKGNVLSEANYSVNP